MAKQIEFQNGNAHQVAWVEFKNKLKVGDMVTFKDHIEGETFGPWTVTKINEREVEIKDLNTERTWKSGGLV